ncbi:TIR domain-containing protein [Caenimonas koreensis DSM 17982]|uniref:TIR domain-containing protein n=2 Tax=Caenimonas TaxID=763439 RepID=A0A844B788_9BURK|nr:TIR domain-containing protein [Caenimonas koreensis DSM 17982]
MANVFFSYSHEDEELRNRLEKHLALLKRQGLIEAWHDRRILAGSELDETISANLESADIILLLVSADFLASDYCYSREMGRAMERHAEGEAVVIPVILKPCDWHSAPFGKLLATPRDGKAVTSWANVEEALADVASHIRKRVEDANRKGGKPASAVPPQAVPANAAAAALSPASLRSSNLRLKQEFNEHDRDTFLHDGFELFAQFFEGSLGELKARNSGIQTTFRRIDANCFTATIYNGGKKVSECAIRIGGIGGRGITYSSDANPNGNSFNGSVSVESDDQGLYFSPMVFGFGEAEKRMTKEAAAEHFWATLIRPLQ